ncbi:MAG: guanylate kinase [Candidatus Moranbacteria bacterium CG23_combo_of_CG06-09_8_20_14_all_35_22]|nr:MAG: guanylate kinase [Candidatus Moranbacteria bacterium CG23_combo_of_CG06-09_8_20_14_all_35_22]
MSNIFIISGPSGAGQDSVIRGLKKEFDLDKIITTTTREMRPEDAEGISYYFISKEEFEKKIKEDKFFEYALEDNGNYYGGTYAELERVKKNQKPVIWKIDYKGVLNAKKILPEAKSIFIHIPFELIRNRLEKRGESEEIIQARLDYSHGWYENENIFDYKITNEEGKLEKTVQKVAEIIKENL